MIHLVSSQLRQLSSSNQSIEHTDICIQADPMNFFHLLQTQQEKFAGFPPIYKVRYHRSRRVRMNIFDQTKVLLVAKKKWLSYSIALGFTPQINGTFFFAGRKNRLFTYFFLT
jgi:hypothetical protein